MAAAGGEVSRSTTDGAAPDGGPMVVQRENLLYEMKAHGREWVQQGVRLLGGCCKTDPIQIAQMCDTLEHLA